MSIEYKIIVGFKPIKFDHKLKIGLDIDQYTPNKDNWQYCLNNPKLYRPLFIQPVLFC